MRRPSNWLSEPLGEGPRLYYGGEASVRRALAFRAAAILVLGAFVVALFWWERDGLRDNLDGHLDLVDVVYFAAVTLTTTGYGDIVPVTSRARALDAVVITPVRLLIWVIFFGTAYQLLFQRAIERLRIRRRQASMQDHYVLCGFDNGGQSAAAELVARGTPPGRIVVIDRDEAAMHLAAARGHVGLRGDATREALLVEARVAQARAVILNLPRDDATVLAVLTTRHLAPTVRVLARVQEPENEKLIRRSGADVALHAARLAGVLLVNAVAGSAVLDYVQDLVTASGHLQLHHRPARPDEVGRPPGRSPDGMVLRVIRDGAQLSFWDAGLVVAAGDELLVLGRGEDAPGP